MDKEMTTVKGIPLAEAFALLDQDLPEGAYAPIQGGPGAAAGLTDIEASYLWETLLQVFGPLGVGWGYEIVEESHVPAAARDAYQALVTVETWYWYKSREGEIKKSAPWTAFGGSENRVLTWARKGALTNALSSAWALAGWQLHIYKGRGRGGYYPPATPAPRPRATSVPVIPAQDLEDVDFEIDPIPPVIAETGKTYEAAIAASSLDERKKERARAAYAARLAQAVDAAAVADDPNRVWKTFGQWAVHQIKRLEEVEAQGFGETKEEN